MTDAIQPFDPELLIDQVAFAMFLDSGEGESAETYATLDDETREALHSAARTAIQTFTQAAADLGVRFLPPGILPRPKSVDEATVMIAMGQEFLRVAKRKPGLVGSVAPRLILPNGVKH